MLHCRFVRWFALLAASVRSSALLLTTAAWGQAQTVALESSSSTASSVSSVVPGVVRFSGTVKDAEGALSGAAGNRVALDFALYKDSQGGEALWHGTQNVTLDANRRYTVQLGSLYPLGFHWRYLPPVKRAGWECNWRGRRNNRACF